MKLAYDCHTLRPGSAEMQLMLGCDPDVALAFNEKLWLHEATPGLTVREIDPEKFPELVRITHRHHAISAPKA